MFGERLLNVTLTEAARLWLQNFLSICLSQGLKQPLASLHWAKVSGQGENEWLLGVYERKVAIGGEGWIGIGEGFEFFVLQKWILDIIDNRTMDIDGSGRVTFLPPITRTLIDEASKGPE